MLFPHQQRQKSDNTSANKNQTPTKKENETEETNDTIDVPVYHEFSKDDDGEDANTKRHGFPEGFDKSKFTEEVKIRMPDLGEDNGMCCDFSLLRKLLSYFCACACFVLFV